MKRFLSIFMVLVLVFSFALEASAKQGGQSTKLPSISLKSGSGKAYITITSATATEVVFNIGFTKPSQFTALPAYGVVQIIPDIEGANGFHDEFVLDTDATFKLPCTAPMNTTEIECNNYTIQVLLFPEADYWNWNPTLTFSLKFTIPSLP